jgi:SAM-dependent methyltransferase
MREPEMPRPGPDRGAALAQYRKRAGIYDLELALFEPIRREAIALLGLRRGEAVFDVGCGTGLSLPLLHRAVGAQGRIIGIEQSPEMIERARQRVREHRWSNVTLVCAPVEAAALRQHADAALFHFTHDILRRPEAVANIVGHLRPGAKVVASGLKWSGPMINPVNVGVLVAARHSVSTLEGLRQPWDRLAEHLDALQLRTRILGAVFIASGRIGASA